MEHDTHAYKKSKKKLILAGSTRPFCSRKTVAL